MKQVYNPSHKLTRHAVDDMNKMEGRKTDTFRTDYFRRLGLQYREPSGFQ